MSFIDQRLVCLQETKMSFIDKRLLRKFCPRCFDHFVYVPSVGAFGGIIVIWNSAILRGTLVETKGYGIVIDFISVHWTLVTVYGPCRGQPRDEFVKWLYNLQIPFDDNWLLLGDFNFMRYVENRNLPGGDINDMFLFNEVIGHLGLIEIPIKRRQYTWSSMQDQPLLEQIDWFFTSTAWTSNFPNTLVFPLARTASDHVPCVVSIDTNIPKAKVFRFENYWANLPRFLECVADSWCKPTKRTSSADVISAKFKGLRYSLKRWHTSLSKVRAVILECNKIIMFLDSMEEQRPLYRPEHNFHSTIKLHLEEVLRLQYIYWKQRCTIRSIEIGEENIFFMA